MVQRIVRIKRVKGAGSVKAAARHNLREIAAERGGAIDPTLTGQNVVLFGPSNADDVSADAESLLAQTGPRTLRKDAVRAVEIVVSLPASTNTTLQDQVFRDSVDWAERYFGAPLLSAVVHRDESMPHCHLLILPLVGGRMIGSKLVGYKGKLRAMLSDFDKRVGEPNGLAAPVELGSATRRRMIEQAFSVLQANSGLQEDVLSALLRPHEADPLPLMEALHLSNPKKPAGFSGLIRLMTKPVARAKSQRGEAKRREFSFAAPGHLDLQDCKEASHDAARK
jgi:hypothetical protein